MLPFIRFFIIMIYLDKSYFIFRFLAFRLNFVEVIFLSLVRRYFSFLFFAFMFLFIRFFIIRIYFELCYFYFFVLPIKSLTSSIVYFIFSIFLPNDDPSFLCSTESSSSVSVSISSLLFSFLNNSFGPTFCFIGDFATVLI
jgi:hypothetical protein